MYIQKVNSLKVLYECDGRDGFTAKVEIDGVQPPSFNPPLHEKTIKVRIKHHEKVSVEVEYITADRKNLTVLYEPKNFECEVGKVKVRTKPDRFPCEILLHGLEFGVDSLHFQFVRGEPVWMNLRLCPWAEPIVVEKV